MKAYSHCTHSDWKALTYDDCFFYVKWGIRFRLISQRQVSMSQIWQQNGVNWASHQRNEERKSSEAKLNLFPFLKLSWVGVEESCGRERGFEGNTFHRVSVLFQWCRTMNSRVDSQLLFTSKKTKILLYPWSIKYRGIKRKKERRRKFPPGFSNHLIFLFSKGAFITLCSWHLGQVFVERITCVFYGSRPLREKLT